MFQYYNYGTSYAISTDSNKFNNADRFKLPPTITPFSILARLTNKTISGNTEQSFKENEKLQRTFTASPFGENVTPKPILKKTDIDLKTKTNTKDNKKLQTRSPTTKLIEKIKTKTKRIITERELTASVTSAAQAGVLGTLLLCLTALGFLCSKGILTINFSNMDSVVHPATAQIKNRNVTKSKSKQSHCEKIKKSMIGGIKTSHRTSKVHKINCKTEAVKTLQQTQKYRTKVKNKESNLKRTRELTWKSRTCFTVDETKPVQKENVLLNILSKTTDIHPMRESKRGQTYLKQPSFVEITLS